MSKKDNIDENPLNFYYPTVDDIYKETYKKLQKIIGWEEFKNRWEEVFQEYISKNDLKGWSIEFVMVIYFSNEIRKLTDLFNQEYPEDPEHPDSKDLTPEKIKKFNAEFNLYVESVENWCKQLLKIAPVALQEIEIALNYEIEIGQPKIEYSGEDPRKFMNIVFSFERIEDWDSAIEYLNKAFKAFYNSPFTYAKEYSIYDFIRLPLYTHNNGKRKEAWKLFHDFLDGNFPIEIPSKIGLEDEIITTWERRVIYSRMRNCCIKEKRYQEALLYRCLDCFFDIAGIYLISKIKTDISELSFNTSYFPHPVDASNLFEESSNKKRLIKNLKTRARMANLLKEVEKIAEIVNQAIEALPDFKLGEKIIVNGLKDFTN